MDRISYYTFFEIKVILTLVVGFYSTSSRIFIWDYFSGFENELKANCIIQKYNSYQMSAIFYSYMCCYFLFAVSS